MSAMRKTRPDYERLLAQERLILDATEAVVRLLDDQTLSRQELARRLGKTKGFISRILSGEHNMTLRTLADVGYALDCEFSMNTCPHADSVRAPEPRWLSAELATTVPPAEARHPLAPIERAWRADNSSAESHEYALAA
jgi:transcriptional regulator with XRE-family HTH domain